jgi:hypothetical protein
MELAEDRSRLAISPPPLMTGLPSAKLRCYHRKLTSTGKRCTMTSLDRVLDEAMALPLNQQEMLIQILHRRILDRRREEIARDAEISLAEFRSGKLNPQRRSRN